MERQFWKPKSLCAFCASVVCSPWRPSGQQLKYDSTQSAHNMPPCTVFCTLKGYFQGNNKQKTSKKWYPVVIWSILYSRDPISVVSELYNNPHYLINSRRNSNEWFISFEFKFSAQMLKYNAHRSTVHLPESVYALLLLSNTGVNYRQRVDVLSEATTAHAAAAICTAGSTS